MARVNVSPEQLRELSAAYQQAADELRSRASLLSTPTESLLLDWVGSASSAFQTLARDVDSSQYELISTLEKMARTLANAAQAFESADQNISSAFQ